VVLVVEVEVVEVGAAVVLDEGGGVVVVVVGGRVVVVVGGTVVGVVGGTVVWVVGGCGRRGGEGMPSTTTVDRTTPECPYRPWATMDTG